MATRLSNFLKEASPLRPLVARLERLEKLQRFYNEITPPTLAKASRVGSLEGNTLVVIASNGTVASGLKQRLGGLLARIQTREPQITAIRIEVQLETPVGSSKEKQRLTLSAQAAGSLNALAAKLPSSPLKNALERLASRAKTSTKQ
jgi:hypothetical protein